MRTESFKTNDKTQYPKLMITENEKIVLFSSECKGTIVQTCKRDIDYIGYHSNAWVMDCFKDFKGYVKLITD